MIKLDKYGILLVLLMLVSTVVFGQSFEISGKVVDEQQDVLDGAEVVITGTQQVVRTNDKGLYRFTGIAPGQYEIQAFIIGKRVLSKQVEVKNQDVVLNFELSVLVRELEQVTISDEREETFGLTKLNSVEGAAIYEAKKSEVIVLQDITANLATNNSRQVYSRVAGLNIWESDGAGVQLGIGGRGLSPNRNSNFNTRQNGYDIAADALGYP